LLKKLEDVISVDVVHHFMGDHGWTFLEEDGATGDTLHGSDFLHQIYTRAEPDYSGRVTVPVLWDRREETIVNNESSEIIRMLNSAFDGLTEVKTDYCPADLREEIDRVNADVYENVNNGVYRCGFATSQKAYEEAFHALFDCLDRLEERWRRRPEGNR
jgi:putative glutathione S-transferase